MTDSKRLDFLAELMNLSVLLELAPDGIPPADAQWLKDRSERVFVRYELHRRTHDTPAAFRLAVDDASGGARLEPKP